MKQGLHLYFGSIKSYGLENVPKDKPVLFLPNHQNALLDVLLIGVDCTRKPWFLARSDVFKSKTLQTLFEIFQMIPIYRIRDGRESLKNNQAIFDRCSDLLRTNEAIIMFPEGNHNLQRRVRPLSKGFTRILFNTLDKTPDADIQIVPVGLNYKDAVRFPDKVTVHFGKAITLKAWYTPEDEKLSIAQVKKVVSDQLKTLTTHIKDEAEYDTIVSKLNAEGVNFLNPKEANLKLKNTIKIGKKESKNKVGFIATLCNALFMLINAPVLIPWRFCIKPSVKEAEFLGTLRFAFAMIVYPIYYTVLLVLIGFVFNPLLGLFALLGLLVFNWLFVKLS